MLSRAELKFLRDNITGLQKEQLKADLTDKLMKDVQDTLFNEDSAPADVQTLTSALIEELFSGKEQTSETEA